MRSRPPRRPRRTGLVLIEAVVPQMDIPPLLTELAQSASAANAGTPSRIRSSR